MRADDRTYIAGSLGQAMFWRDDAWHFLAGPDEAIRPPTSNDVRFFFKNAIPPREINADSETSLRAALKNETLTTQTLDRLLIGMDADYSDGLRTRAIRWSEGKIAASDPLADAIRRQFLIPSNSQEWDAAGAQTLAQAAGAPHSARMYGLIADGTLDNIADDIRQTVGEQRGWGIDGVQTVETLLKCGLIGLITHRMSSDGPKISTLLFDMQQDPNFRGFNELDPNFRLLATILKKAEQRTSIDSDLPTIPNTLPPSRDAQQTNPAAHNPITATLIKVKEDREKLHRTFQPAGFAAYSAIKLQIEWIGNLIQQGRLEKAQQDLINLIQRQGRDSRIEYIPKSLCSVANYAREYSRYDFAFQIVEAIVDAGIEDPATLCLKAEILRELGRLEDALSLYKTAQNTFPNDPSTYNGQAETLRELGRLEDALSLYKIAQNTFPNDPVTYTGQAETLRELGCLEDALSLYKTAQNTFPNNPVTYTGQAETLRELGRLEDALSLYKTAQNTFPNDPITYNGQAETLRELGRLEDALSLYKTAQNTFPNNPVTYTGQAETLRELGRLEDALSLYKTAQNTFPNNPVTYTGQAETLRELGRLEDALSLYKTAQNTFPNDPFTYNGQAETLRELGRLEDALSLYKTAQNTFPNDPFTYTGQAETLRELGRLEDALSLYKIAQNTFPNDPVTYTGQAETLRELGRLEDALSLYKIAQNTFPNDPVTYTGQAETLRELGRLEDALSLYKIAQNTFPNNSIVRNGAANLYALKGDLDTVRTLLNPHSAIPQSKQDWIAVHILAMALLKVGDVDAALEGLSYGKDTCPYFKSQAYFKTAWAFARTFNTRPHQAIASLQSLERDPSLSRTNKNSVILLSTRLAAESGEHTQAQTILKRLLPLETLPHQHTVLFNMLDRRFGLFKHTKPANDNTLKKRIADAEFSLMMAA